MNAMASKLECLKEQIFESDNRACFIERERILNQLQTEMAGYNSTDRYALMLSALLSKVSTPVDKSDYFVGRVPEALPDEGMKAPNGILSSIGHMSLDYEKMLRLGLKGILAEIQHNAIKKGDKESLSFAKNAEIVVSAIREYANRYAKESAAYGKLDAARALSKVPFEPAYDFYSALQSVWIIHMIASCYVGSRDYAFGRFDKYMLPYYEKAIKAGKTKQELCELLAGFLIKTNEICGRTTHNYQRKPVLCQASKQYINIGGENPNEFSFVVLEAAMLLNMAQPQIVVLLKPDADEEFTQKTFEALSVLTDKMNIYNYDLISKALINKGIEEAVAKDFTYSACCTLDLNYHSFRREYFVPVPHIFLKTLENGEYNSLESFLDAFRELLRSDMQNYADREKQRFSKDEQRRRFVLDSILLSDSAIECRYACDGNAKYDVLNLFCPGIATVGDSLMVLDKLVYKEKRYTYGELVQILKEDFSNHGNLRSEILSYTKFGNDTNADTYAVMAGEAFLDAVDSLELNDNFYAVGSFYSLERDNTSRHDLGATPDGRKSGTPFSENQSPTYGADKSGITALLKSVSKLPFDRTAGGGLNLTFSQKVSSDILKALVLSYFNMGGLHVGISVINRSDLQDAMIDPDKYKSLTVRLYGFSEYFVSLPEWQQIAVLNRTEYKQ